MDTEIKRRKYVIYEFELDTIEGKKRIYKSIRKTGHQECTIEPYYPNDIADICLVINPNKASQIKADLWIKNSVLGVTYSGFDELSSIALKIKVSDSFKKLKIWQYIEDYNPVWDEDPDFSN